MSKIKTKGKFSIIVSALMILSAACGQRSPNRNAAESLSSTVQIEHATDKVVNRFGSFYEYNDNDFGEKIVIWTDGIQKNFDFISVGSEYTGEQISFFAEDILYSINELTSEKALMIKMFISEGIPSRGISFLDENSVKRYFYISESGIDGSLSMVEFQNLKNN